MRVKLLHKKFLNLVEVFGKFLATVDDCLELLLFVEVFHQGALYGVEALEYLGDRTFHSLVNLRGLGGYERGNQIVGFFYAYEYDVALMNLLSLCGTPEQFANYQPKP